jgi:transcriptional regulator with XRE-family HTH domain
MRQKELAKYTGVCEDYISMIEREKRIPAKKTLVRIASVLEVSLEELTK